MRISSKVVVPPPCQRKSQAMTNTIGSDSEMQRFESFHYPRAQAGGRARAGGARGARSAGWRAPDAGQDPSRRGAILAVSL